MPGTVPDYRSAHRIKRTCSSGMTDSKQVDKMIPMISAVKEIKSTQGAGGWWERKRYF